MGRAPPPRRGRPVRGVLRRQHPPPDGRGGAPPAEGAARSIRRGDRPPPAAFGGVAAGAPRRDVLATHWLADCARIRCPALVIAGGDDSFPTAEMSARVAATIPGARLHVVAGGSHFPNRTHRAEVQSVIAEFFAAIALADGRIVDSARGRLTIVRTWRRRWVRSDRSSETDPAEPPPPARPPAPPTGIAPRGHPAAPAPIARHRRVVPRHRRDPVRHPRRQRPLHHPDARHLLLLGQDADPPLHLRGERVRRRPLRLPRHGEGADAGLREGVRGVLRADRLPDGGPGRARRRSDDQGRGRAVDLDPVPHVHPGRHGRRAAIPAEPHVVAGIRFSFRGPGSSS